MNSHVETGSQSNKEGNGTSRLWHHIYGVNNSVNNACNGNGTEKIYSQECWWISQGKEKSNDKEGNNVFQIITMGSRK